MAIETPKEGGAHSSSLGRSAPERLGGRWLFATVPRGVAEGIKEDSKAH